MPSPLVKPYRDFPLTPHKQGYWVKVINGKQHRFGTRWCDPDEALAMYLNSREDIKANREPEPVGDMTLREAMIKFMVSRKNRMEAGEITKRSYEDYLAECRYARDLLGAGVPVESIGPRQFASLRESYTGAPSTISNRIGRIRVLFNYLYQAGILKQPPRYGAEFAKPSAKTRRIHRAAQPKKIFTPDEIKLLLGSAKPQMRAMIWLALFAGFGNTDCGTVGPQHFYGEWVEYHRPKTGLSRKAWLPLEAIHAIIAIEWPLKTRYGNPWSQDRATNPISAEFRKLATKLDISLSFYALRHTCETIGGRAKDQVAMDYVMGHVTPGMASTDRGEVGDVRLQEVGKAILDWLSLDLLSEMDQQGLHARRADTTLAGGFNRRERNQTKAKVPEGRHNGSSSRFQILSTLRVSSDTSTNSGGFTTG